MAADDTEEDGGLNDSVDQLETEKQALILLKKLQDLKVWQSRQEERLLEEQRNQILDLQQLGLPNQRNQILDLQRLGLQENFDLQQRLGLQGNALQALHQVRDNRMREDDDTTVSSIVYDDEISVLSEVAEEDSDTTWADRNEDRPQTKDLNLSNGSVMTLTEEGEHHQQYQPQEVEDDFDGSPSSPPPNPEDQVVGGGGRTFAQLMSDQLGVGNYCENEPLPNHQPTRRPVEKKPFLKRGTGLTRFNLPPDPSKQPSRIRRTKSQSGIADIQDTRNPSRLSQETLSFASKKSCPKSPKRIVASKSLSKLDESGSVGSNSSLPRKNSPPARLKLKSPAKKNEPVSQKGSEGASRALEGPSGPLPRGSDPRDSAPRPRELGGVMGGGRAEPRLLGGGRAEPRLQDSVENSFREKLTVQEKRHEKELKELAVFEMLEDAANDSSFCSTSSRVKTLMDNSILPSPSRPANFQSTPSARQQPDSTPLPNSKSSFASSTPLDAMKNDGDVENPSLGETLMEDIRRFVMNEDRQHKPQFDLSYNDHQGEEEEEDGEEDDESTVCDEDEVTIGRDWRDRMAEWDKENQEVGAETGGKQHLLEFSPPQKLPKNSPSYLIWSIFTREREERLRQQQKTTSSGGTSNYLKSSSSSNGGNYDGPKSAPARITKENAAPPNKPASPLSLANNLTSNDDISYQSTLLQMRVVELEQEIDTFKKENTKLISLKKKLTEEKLRLTKDWEEFEKVREENRKKIEEERRRVRREKMLFEKNQRESTNSGKVCTDCEENRSKVLKLQEDLNKKENKWTAALSKLQEQVNKMEKDNKILGNENQRLRIKTTSSKVAATHLGGSKVDVRVVSHSKPGSGGGASDKTPDSGIRSVAASLSGCNSGVESEEELLDLETRNSISSTVYAALCGDTPRMNYSPADSLDSSLTLVSGVPNSQTDSPQVLQNSERGTREKRYPDGKLEIWYSNGNRKEVSADGKTVKVFYYNGDLKESESSGLVKYLYSQTQTWHITHPDSREVLRFNNGQEEVRFPDGSMEISFPDGSVKKMRSDGSEDIRFPDGTRVEVGVGGDRVLHLPNGQREEHTKDMKKRVYPDGTIKILHTDGRQETKYSNGRIRVKDKDGKLVKDTHS